jgi:simple sugar transport system ATP-binding protein
LAANDGAELCAEAGSITAVLGENGAGKTTLARILAGEVRPDAGEFTFEGRPWKPWRAGARRAALVHQHPILVDDLSVAENLFLGREPAGPGGLLLRGPLARAARELCARYSVDLDPDMEAGKLGLADRQRLELLRALGHDARVIILDEPSSQLSEEEADALYLALEAIKTAGKAIILITHRLPEALRAASFFYVLRSGRTVLSIADPDKDALLGALFGEAMDAEDGPEPCLLVARTGDVVLNCAGLELPGRGGGGGLRGLDLELRAGRVVCVLSITGNGAEELEDALSGMREPHEGSIRIQGTELAGRGCAARRKAGMAYLPRERLHRGVALGECIADNLLVHDAEVYRFPGAGEKFRRIRAAEWLSREGMAASAGERVSVLSGGQIQRLVSSRELGTGKPFLLLAEPSWGLDQRAAVKAHESIRAAAAAGLACLVLLSQLREAMALADEIAVLYRGRITLLESNDRSAGLEARLRAAMTGGGA